MEKKHYLCTIKIKTTNEMKKIVISLLSSLGLGIDACISDPTEFAHRLVLRGFFNEFNVTLIKKDAQHFALQIASEVDVVCIEYTLEGTRVCDINVATM